MKYLPLSHTANIHEEKMLGRKICESVDAAEIQFQAKKAKRYRSAFTTEQINYLEKQFNKFPYIGNACRKEVASVLNIPERAIKIWFQNRRMKEKKEVVNKEYNLDRPNNSINNVEFANDPLNNVHSSQSTNDHHQCSLQPALSNHANKINYTNYNVEAKKSDAIKSEKNIREKVARDKIYQLGNKNKLEKSIISKRMPSTTENLSRIHLNKVYNNSDFNKYLEKNKNNGINNCKLAPKKKIKENFKSGNQPIQAASNSLFGTINHQDLPEDLSARNKANVTFSKTPENINLSSAFIPLCNTQNYITPCMSTGNVMWKPFNVMPIISSPSSSSLPIAVTNTELSSINMVQNPCNCNCHMKKLFNHEQGKTSVGASHPQYVIAIPLNKIAG